MPPSAIIMDLCSQKSEIMAELLQKVIEENRQGEAYAPFAGDPNVFNKRFYIESYGCQMNFSDSEIVASILHDQGFGATRNFEDADLVLLNTCSIREKAEQTVRNRLQAFRKIKDKKPGIIFHFSKKKEKEIITW